MFSEPLPLSERLSNCHLAGGSPTSWLKVLVPFTLSHDCRSVPFPKVPGPVPAGKSCRNAATRAYAVIFRVAVLREGGGQVGQGGGVQPPPRGRTRLRCGGRALRAVAEAAVRAVTGGDAGPAGAARGAGGADAGAQRGAAGAGEGAVRGGVPPRPALCPAASGDWVGAGSWPQPGLDRRGGRWGWVLPSLPIPGGTVPTPRCPY